MSPASKAWAALGVGVAAYEVMCPKGETLSEGVDRALERHPAARAATIGLIAVTAMHLANILPERFDPYHRALIWKD